MRVFHRRLEPTEEGAKQELHFSFDAEIDGEAQIFWECVDMTLPDVLEQPANLKKLGLDLQRKKGDAKPKWFRFKKVILPTAPGVSNEGRSSPLLALAPLFLGPEFQLGARWNRLVEAVKTRKKREKTGKKWARYGLKRVNKEGTGGINW